MTSGRPGGAAPILHIRLFGGVDLRLGENPLPPLESARAESLLAYLLLHAETPQPRQRLAFLLWPDSTEPQARTNLRHVLHILRRSLPDPDRYIAVSPRTLQWRAGASCWLDVAAFEAAIARAERQAADGGLVALREAVELYAGDLVEGCYDEWVLGERERLRERYLGALERLTALCETIGDQVGAIHYAERLLRHDPLREEAYRLVMRLHDARGDRARALRVYHVCTATLERELGVEPSAPTRAAYEALLSPAGEPADETQQTRRVGGPPLVGRAFERARLAALWRESEAGRAQLVLVSGEPGVGKSRLVEEVRSWCAQRGAATAEARSYPAEGALAYGSVVAWLRAEAIEGRRGRLDRARLSELARLLPELLDEVPGLVRPEPLPEREQRQRLFEAVARAILAAGGPLLLVADDVQWCDRETLQFLHYLLRVEPNARLLVVATARREDIDSRHPLNDLLAGLHALDRLTEIQLDRLTRAETAALAEQLAGRPVTERDAERLHRETEGNPLFVVEALRADWTSGPADRGWLSPKVQAAIEARLAQLSEPARDLVGVAATIGRAFTVDVLAHASEVDADALVRGLDELWRRRIVREQGADAYDFSHDKIREVAYLALGPARRRRFHLRVAHAVESLNANDPGPVSGQLAAHYEQAGAVDQAVAWYERAADAALPLHANDEAVRLLSRALDLLRMLPDTSERQGRELAVLSSLPTPLGAIDGWASTRLTTVLERAIELALARGIEPAPVLLRSLAFASLSRRDYVGASDLGGRLRRRGERDADEMLVVEAAYVQGIAAFWQGQFANARGHFETAADRYRPDLRRSHLLRYGLDPKVICLGRLGNTLWFLGRPDSAVRVRDAALALADEVGHPYSRAIARLFAAVLALDMGDPERVRADVAALTGGRGNLEAQPIQISAEAIAGYLDVVDGRAASGIDRIRRALDEADLVDHAPGMRATHLRIFVEACVVAGDAETGLAAADRALATDSADRLWEAEVRRLRAEFLAALGAPWQDIEAELKRALQVARRQKAQSLELRAVVSLVRRQQARGDALAVSHARGLLTTIVDAFPEGLDTGDRRAATMLLGRR